MTALGRFATIKLLNPFHISEPTLTGQERSLNLDKFLFPS